MLLALAFAFSQASLPPFWQLKDALVLNGVSRGGRVPFPQDDFLPHLDDAPAKAGDVVLGRNNSEHKWTAVSADDKGALSRQPQGGYVQAMIHSDTARDAILTITGDGGAYFNGELRPGDVYGYGYLSLPVHLHSGENRLLMMSGRGNLTARLDAPRAAQQFNLADATLPDVLSSDTGNLMGAVVVLNSTDTYARGLKIKATIDGHAVESKIPEIPPYTLRKVPFNFPAVVGLVGKSEPISLELESGSHTLDSGSVDVSVVDPLTTHKRTFISNIDGSLQYYAVVPAKKPSKSNALILTLHGASVEAIGQARAYQAKDWCTIVAATNRRPYGFDWEDMGRLDALEVLNIAKRKYPHDPARVELTGHSMGGHGTWSIGTLYPNLFAAIAPSAGWVSFQSYAGGFNPTEPTPVEQLFLDEAAPSDTLGRVRNTLEGETYILHGAVDDNVPVTEARTMKKALSDIGAKYEYHEQPGANHWWGNQCVDWPPLFEMLQSAKLKADDDPAPIDFTTPNPQISSTLRWITVRQQLKPGLSSVQASVKDGVVMVTTKNVRELEVRRPSGNISSISVNGQASSNVKWPLALTIKSDGSDLHSNNNHWNPIDKNPNRYGGFKLGLQNRMIFVVGTAGSDAAQLSAFARSMAEKLYYQGNGAVDIWTDTEYLKSRNHDRNVVLFGNADDNLAWAKLLSACPIQVHSGSIKANKREFLNSAALITYPLAGSKSAMVLGFGVTGTAGIDVLERLPMLASGPAYPDWTILDATTEPNSGIRAVTVAGDFGPDWKLSDSISAAK
jgi:poly(3-hydroxybutyrate) depolymerase